MSENTRSFIGYEYKEVIVKQNIEELYIDSYPSFGWTVEGRNPSIKEFNSVKLKLKRDRKIRNKMELTRLQRQFESYADEIDRLEKSKGIGASAAAYIIGIAGTAFMAGSVFSYLGGRLLASVILAIPGFMGWIIPYFCYIRIRNKKTEEINPLIDNKYDRIYEVCQKANSLLPIEE